MSTSVILLCAGKSKKMQSFGNRSLLNVKSETLIENQIKTIRNELPTAEIVVVLGYESDKLFNHIKSKKVRFVTNENYDETYSLKSTVWALRATTNHNIFVVHGDILFKNSIFRVNKRRSAAIYSCSRFNDIGLLINSSSVLRFSYGLSNVWSKVIYLNKELSLAVRDYKITPNNEKCLDFEMYNSLLEQGFQIDAVEGNTTEINSTKDLKCVQ